MGISLYLVELRFTIYNIGIVTVLSISWCCSGIKEMIYVIAMNTVRGFHLHILLLHIPPARSNSNHTDGIICVWMIIAATPVPLFEE